MHLLSGLWCSRQTLSRFRCGVPMGEVPVPSPRGAISSGNGRQFTRTAPFGRSKPLTPSQAYEVAAVDATSVGQEIEAKLEIRVSFDLSSLWAHDLAGRASSFKAMVVGGMAIDRAAMLSGLMATSE